MNIYIFVGAALAALFAAKAAPTISPYAQVIQLPLLWVELAIDKTVLFDDNGVRENQMQ